MSFRHAHDIFGAPWHNEFKLRAWPTEENSSWKRLLTDSCCVRSREPSPTRRRSRFAIRRTIRMRRWTPFSRSAALTAANDGGRSRRSALIVMLRKEPGATAVAEALTRARMSVVNLAEVISHFLH